MIYARIPATSWMKVLVAVGVAGLVAWMFKNVDGTFQGVRNRNGVLFFSCVAIGFMAV